MIILLAALSAGTKTNSLPNSLSLFCIREMVFLFLVWVWKFCSKCLIRISTIFIMELKKESKDFLSTCSRLIQLLQYVLSESWMILRHSFQFILEGGLYFGPFFKNFMSSWSCKMLRSPVMTWELDP